MERILRITGTGKVSVKPDIVILSFTISELSTIYGDAVDLLNNRVSKLRKVVESAGISKSVLKTRDFSIRHKTKWDKEKDQHIFVGYDASHDLSLEIDFDNSLLNTLITKLSSNLEGVDFDITFGVKNSEKYKEELINDALSKAQEYANIIVDATNIKLKEIINIDFSFSELVFRSERMLAESDYSASMTSMPDLNPDDIENEKSITVTWKIE